MMNSEESRENHCPNCGLVGYSRGDAVDGDLRECGNSNCAVYLFQVSEMEGNTDR